MHDLFKSIVDDFTSLPAKVAAATKASEGNEPQPDYRQALTDLVALVDRIHDATEGNWPSVDINCAVCTQGCAPASGVCAWHAARRLVKA